MFHVPESNRLIKHTTLGSTKEDGNNGFFILDSIEPGWKLAYVASDGLGWEHVSVHTYNYSGKQRTPNWKEMCYIKDLFWNEEDVVIQYHPSKSNYINMHPNTLHLWKPTNQEIPIPDKILVGI